MRRRRYSDRAAALHDVYDMQLWADLKHIQYGLNWKVLESVLPRYSHSTALERRGRGAEQPSRLLNRLVSIGKKSCPRLPMQDRHIDFVLDIVRKKYCQGGHRPQHLAHSLSASGTVSTGTTMDGELAERFTESKQNLQLALGASIHLEVPRPDGTGEKTGVKKVQGFKGSRVQE